MAYQVSVFLENKLGHFSRVTRALGESGVNIRTMTLTNTANGWGILNLLVNSPQKAVNALVEKGFSAALREIIAVEMNDRPGGLHEVLEKIAAAGISFDNAFGRITDEGRKAILVLDVGDVPTARIRLSEAGISELPDEIVYGNGL